mmetsp:Transcript_2581/g.7778  ORF Transcript_2581/g.7778 Transcript_2581/m.7778 type:complete len:210 (+) Transcript_2581:821-1450(+)
MKQGFFWPSRQMRAMACRSFAGFQSGSYMTSRLAPMRLRPHPPALEESRKAKALSFSGRLKSCTSFMRLATAIVPSRRCTGQLRWPHIFSMMSSVIVQLEMMTTRSPVREALTTSRRRQSSANLPESSSCTGRCAERKWLSRRSTSANIARASSSSKPASSRCMPADRTRKGWFTRPWSFLMVPRTVRFIRTFWSSRTFRATLDRRKLR